MTSKAFVRRVSVETAIGLGVLGVLAGWFAGPSAGLGVVAGGILALANLWCLSARAMSAAAAAGGAGWALAAMLRLAATAVALALILMTGLAHPVGIVAGLTVLPLALVARGLAASRET
jgi:hypothetical protein